MATELLCEGALTPDQGAEATYSLLQMDEPPTAIVFALDAAALGAYRVAQKFGLAIGQDLSVTGYDGIPEGSFASPPLSTFVVDNRSAGARLAALLIAQIRQPANGPVAETTDARFVSRGSDRPPRLTSSELARLIRKQHSQNGRIE